MNRYYYGAIIYVESLKKSLAVLPPLVWALTVTIFINRIGGMAKFFMPMYLRNELDIGFEIIGWLLAGYGLGRLIGSYVAGVLSDHVNPRTLLLVLLLASALCLLLLGVAGSVASLAFLLLMGGASEGGVRPLIDRMIMDNCSEQERELAQSLNRVAINLAFSAAGLIAGFLASFDYRAVFIFDGVANLIAMVWLYGVFRTTHRTVATPRRVAAEASEETSRDVRSPYTDVPFMIFMVVTLLVAVMYDTTNSVLGNYLLEYHSFGPVMFGWQCALNGVLVVVFQLPLTGWAQRLQYNWRIGIGIGLTAAGLLALPFCTNVWMVSLSTVTWTVGEMLFLPSMAILVMKRAEGGRRGHYLGLSNAMWSSSVLFAPIVGGQIYAYFGGNSVWFICASLGLVAILLLNASVKRFDSDQPVLIAT